MDKQITSAAQGWRKVGRVAPMVGLSRCLNTAAFSALVAVAGLFWFMQRTLGT